ncbi:MAG: hypothetical protein RLY50_791 [Actinomycetota bacterium]|jgi:DNA-binding response OmpR family regulator
MRAVKVLLVEDDRSIADSVTAGLSRASIDVVHVESGEDAVESVRREEPAVILMDVGLPGMDGLDASREIRTFSQVPIIIVSARGDELDRVLGLELGADDYVVKPFSQRELLARIKAVLRRSGHREEEPSRAGRLKIDSRTRSVSVDGDEVHLTPKEFDLLEFLASEPGTVFRRNDILEHVWDVDWFGTTKTLDAHVASLRKKIGHPGWIQAVRGVGFKFHEADDDQ